MKKAQIFFVVFVILIMTMSIIEFTLIKDDPLGNDYIEYKNFKFYPAQNNQYIVTINNVQFIFNYLPNELNDISLPDFSLNNEKYYLLVNYSEKDNNLDYSLSKLGYTLNLINIKPVLACLNQENCKEDIPIKDCNTDSFYFKKSTINKVYLKDKCIVIEGDNLGISKSVDKINLKLAKIE